MMIKKITFLLLLTFALSYRIGDKGNNLLQSDHFYSEQKSQANFQIDNAESHKPLLIILKERKHNKYEIKNNHITMRLHHQKQTITCDFEDYFGLCVLPAVVDTNITLYVSCQKIPCQVNWMIYQPQIAKAPSNQMAYGLYRLDDFSDRMVAAISCNDPEVKSFKEDVNIYSESHYERGGTMNEIYFLFSTHQNGYIFVDIKEDSRKCAHLNIASIPVNITLSEDQIRNFAKKDLPAEMRLAVPNTDFRMDCLLNRLSSDNSKPIMQISLWGISRQSEHLITKQQIKSIYKQKQIVLSITFKKIEDEYEQLLLKFQTNSLEMTVISFVINEYQVQQVELGEKNYFDLKAGQIISYKLLSEDAGDNEEVFFIVDDNKIKLSTQKCLTKMGCEFQLQAIQDVVDHIWFSSTPKGQDKVQQIQFLPITKNFKHKARDNVNIYLKKTVKAGKTFEVTVNNLNVLIYASSQQKCQIPSDSCYERTGNYHHPFVYTPKEDGLFLFNLEGLGSGEFILTIIDQDDQFIPLEDGVIFSYTMDEAEDKVLFKYKLKEKIGVTFNLIGPLNQVLLKVVNSNGFTDQQNVEVSSEGLVPYSIDQIQGLQFAIEIQKTSLSIHKTTHFTLLGSTSQTVIRLDNAVTHEQTLAKSAYKQYAFEYDPKQQYIINFYLHNLKADNISIMLSFSNNRVWDKSNLQKMFINKESDYFDLKYISKLLCNEEGADSCEIFMILQNKMEIEVDIAITLMIRNSVIELKDGIWQSYSENTLATSASFYFYPKHYDRSVSIIYSSTHQDLKIVYSLWKTDSKSISPLQWPFPEEPKNKNVSNENSNKPVNQIFIDKQILKSRCQQNCVILITLYRSEISTSSIISDGYFRILAYNNQVELPQNTRISMAVKQDEEKQVLVDLKYVFDKQIITFYSTHSLGSYSLFASVSSETHPRCPEEGQGFDFQIENGETDIEVNQIKAKIKYENMEGDSNIYLCLSIQPLQDSKLTIQYTAASRNQIIKKVHMNSFEEISLDKGQRKIFQIDGFYNFQAKIIRMKGYPYTFIQKCLIAHLKQCKQQMLNTQNKGKQLVSKTEQFGESPCQECVYLFKLQADEPSAVVFHLQIEYSQIQLKQHQITSDFIVADYSGRYIMTHIRGQDVMVNIHVQEGQISATMKDGHSLQFTKSSTKDDKLIHFYIPGSHSKSKDLHEELVEAEINSYMLSTTFEVYHLLINNLKLQSTSTFTISYSSGENKIFLQDGLITDITIEPMKPAIFYYSNQYSAQHIYLTLSMKGSHELSTLQIKCYYLQDGEENNRTQFQVERPLIKDKTPNPTLVLSLPPKNYFQIKLTNPSGKSQALSIGINHQEVIFLPFNHQYPFSMRAKEEVNFLVEVGEEGYISINIRKCDESDPIFSYAYNYDAFIKGQFNSQIVLNDDPTFEYLVKVKNPGTFYINFKSSYENSLLSIKLQFYKERPNKEEVKAGHRGTIDYEIVNSKRAEIFFSPITCGSEKCPKVEYFCMSAQKLQDLYSQLVCPSNYFSSSELTFAAPITLHKISFHENQGVIKYSYQLLDHISFVGVKAIGQKGQQVYYRPIQIITFWGQLSRTSQTHKITITFILFISIFSLLFFVRYNARKGYRPISENAE